MLLISTALMYAIVGNRTMTIQINYRTLIMFSPFICKEKHILQLLQSFSFGPSHSHMRENKVGTEMRKRDTFLLVMIGIDSLVQMSLESSLFSVTIVGFLHLLYSLIPTVNHINNSLTLTHNKYGHKTLSHYLTTIKTYSLTPSLFVCLFFIQY